MKKEEILSQEEIDALMTVFSKKTLADETLNETDAEGQSQEPLGRLASLRSNQAEQSEYKPKSLVNEINTITGLTSHESASSRYPKQSKNGIEYKDRFPLIDKKWEKLKKQVELISESLSYSLTNSLSELLRHDFVLNNLAVENPVSYEDFLASMNSPSCISVINSEIPGMTVLLELDLNLAYSIIDIILGGKGDNSLTVTRALTSLELKLIKKPVERILSNLSSILNLKLHLEEVFTYPSQININSLNEMVIPLSYDIMPGDIKEEDETTFSKPIHTVIFCIPRITLESNLSNQNIASIDDKDDNNKYSEIIQKSPFINLPLRLQAHFPKAEVTIGKLLEMDIGETIVLDMHPDDDLIEVELLVEGCPKFKGGLGAIGRYKAVEII